jgi:hypothetical protein
MVPGIARKENFGAISYPGFPKCWSPIFYHLFNIGTARTLGSMQFARRAQRRISTADFAGD